MDDVTPELHWLGIAMLASGLGMLANGMLLSRVSKRLGSFGVVLQRFSAGFLPAGALLYFRPDMTSVHISVPLTGAGVVWGGIRFMHWWDENSKRPTQ